MTVCTPLLLAALIGAAAVPVKVFEEEFDRYPEHSPVFHEDSHIEEGLGRKSMDFHPEKKADLRKTPFAVTGDPVNFDLTFKFFFGKDSARSFSIPLYFKNPEKPAAKPFVTEVSFSDQGAKVRYFPSSSSPVNWNFRNLGPLPEFLNRRYSQARISVRGGYAEVWVERSGKWYLEARGQLTAPGMILTGFNVAGTTQVRLDQFRVWKYADDLKSPEVKQNFDYKSDSVYEVSGIEYPGFFTMSLDFGGEKPLSLNFQAVAELGYTRVTRVKKEEKSEKIPLPDAGYTVRFPEQRFPVVIRTRPNMAAFTPEDKDEIAQNWTTYPAASKSPLRIQLKDAGNGTYQVWFNGKMANNIQLEKPLRSVEFSLPGGQVIAKDAVKFPGKVESGFLPLDPAAALNWSPLWSDPAANQLSKPSFVEGIPFLSSPAYKFPLSVCRESLGTFALECDGYLSRSAFDAFPLGVHFSVPAAQYTKAYALCSVDPNARKDMIPVVTARLTNYAFPRQGRAEGICDTTVRLPAKPGDPLPANVKVVGGTKDNPLYLVEFTFDTGSIEDIVFRENNAQMDFEFLGDLYRGDNFYFNQAMKPSLTQSSVIVHAATLRNTPAELRVDQGRPGATWYLAEKPWMNVHVKPLIPGTYTVKTEIFDLRGKLLSTFTEKVTEEKDQKIEFPQKEYGWYGVRTVLSDAGGNTILKRDSSFVLLAPDTRKAGLESPYHAWYIDGSHLTPLWPVWSDLAKRQGTRRTTHLRRIGDKNALFDSEEMSHGEFTLGQFPSPASSFKTEEEAEKMIKEWTAHFPHCKAAVIFHENLYGPFPLELVGGKTEITEEVKETDKKKAEEGRFKAEMWRKYAPDVQLVVGNSTTSLGGLARLFRQNFPRNLIDKMGDENTGMTEPPEHSAYGVWSLKRLAEIYGYKDLMPTACYEWRCRGNRHMSPARFASFAVRDDLVAHAWHFDLMNGGGSSTPGNSYWNSIWHGASYSRNPLLDPAPAAASTSVMTQVLDCAKFTRLIPTGSLSAYVEEFKRGDEYIYVLWTARGTVKTALAFGGKADLLKTELFGAQKNVSTDAAGAFQTEISEEPCYITTKVPLKTVSVEMQRTYPQEAQPEGKNSIVCAMDKAEDWNVVKGVNPRIVVGEAEQKYFFHETDFTIKNVTDDQKGAVIELELAKGEEIPELVSETGFIRLKNPVELPGKPHTVGVECKGNSSWGRIYFELTDAAGEVWLSAGTGGFGCPVYDFPFVAGLNYDGWHTLAFPLTKASSVKVNTPAENEWQWQRTGESGSDGTVRYPVKLTGIGFSMPRKTLVINEMKDVVPMIRFHNFQSWE